MERYVDAEENAAKKIIATVTDVSNLAIPQNVNISSALEEAISAMEALPKLLSSLSAFLGL